MKIPNPILLSLFSVLFTGLAAGGCAGAKALGDLKTEVRTLAEKQDKDQTDLKVQIELMRGELQQLKEVQQRQADDLKRMALKAPAPAPRFDRPDPKVVYSVPVGDAPVRGRRDALVTIVEISDFQCPFCQRVQATLGKLLDEYNQDLRLVYLHNPLPFHQRALPAAIAAECAGQQGKFWQMHDRLFENNRALQDQDLRGYAAQLPGLRLKAWTRCYEDQEPKARIKQDQDTAARIGARGTPTFFINGRILTGAQPIDRFRDLIKEELAKAQNSGIPRGSYYQKAVEQKGRKEI